MYGKWVTVDLGDSVQCKIWVYCTPETSEAYLQKSKRLTKGKTC